MGKVMGQEGDFRPPQLGDPATDFDETCLRLQNDLYCVG